MVYIIYEYSFYKLWSYAGRVYQDQAIQKMQSHLGDIQEYPLTTESLHTLVTIKMQQ